MEMPRHRALLTDHVEQLVPVSSHGISKFNALRCLNDSGEILLVKNPSKKTKCCDGSDLFLGGSARLETHLRLHGSKPRICHIRL